MSANHIGPPTEPHYDRHWSRPQRITRARTECAEDAHDAGACGRGRDRDVSRPDDVARLVARAVDAFDTVSILVNNANVRSYRALMDISREEWRDTLAVTLDGSFYCIQACVPLMRELGRGTIVNIGGSTAHSGRPRRCHVAAAKVGLAGMTSALAAELAPDNITVNCVVPGRIDTGRPDASAGGGARHRSPTGRSASPQEIANLVRFLCGNECRFITGAMLHANGAAYVTIA
jgi:3-oxoacyl-[acyl-carrier protein] reductase